MNEKNWKNHILKKNDIRFKKFDEVDISNQRYRFYLIIKINIITMKKMFIYNRSKINMDK